MNTPPADSSVSRPPRLLDQLRDRIRLRHYSLRTERAYAQWVKRYIHFHGKRHPAELGKGGRGVSDVAGGGAQRGGLHADTGVVRVVVSVQGGAGPGAALTFGVNVRERAGAAADGFGPGRSEPDVQTRRRPAHGLDCAAAIRHWHASAWEALNKSVLDFSAPVPKNLVGAQLCCAMIARRSRAPTVFR